MKRTIFVILALLAASAHAESVLKVSFVDDAWNGSKVPAGQQCARFGGKGATPALRVEQIPAGANALVLEFSDQTYQPMNDGGHGKIGYRIASRIKQASIPSVPGHSFELPAGFFLVEAQRAPTWDKAGAYLPPCSGGKGNTYLVKVRAVKDEGGKAGATLAETTLNMGQY